MKADIVELLQQGKRVKVYPEGYSMYPMFVPGRDAAILEKAEAAQLKRGDVILYRRLSGKLVLHRIWKRRQEGFFLLGDNQDIVEGPVAEEQIFGRLTGFVRKGKEHDTEEFWYRVLTGLWLSFRPVRMPIMKTGAFLKKIVSPKRKEW